MQGSSDANEQQSPLALEEISMVSSCRSGAVVHNINGSDNDHLIKRSSSSSVILQMQQNIIKRGPHHHQDQVIQVHDHQLQQQQQVPLKCPRCDSSNTKFCYYNNYSLSQPRYFCKSCRRYWTKGGSLRNVPVGGGCRKNKLHKTTSTAASNSNSYNININKIIKSTQLPYQHQQHQHQLGAPPRPDHSTDHPDHLVGIVVLQPPPPPPSCFVQSSSASSPVLLNRRSYIDQYSMMVSPAAHVQQQLTHDLLGMNNIPDHNQTGQLLIRDHDQINAADHVADDDQIILDGTTITTRRSINVMTAAGGFPRMDLSLFGLSATSSSVHDPADHHHPADDHMGQIGRSTINHEDQHEVIINGGDHDHQLIMGNIGTLAMENINGAFRGTTTTSDDDSMMNRSTKDLDAAGRMWGSAHDHDDDEWESAAGKDQAGNNYKLDNKQQDQYYWNTMGPWHAMLNSYAAAGPAS